MRRESTLTLLLGFGNEVDVAKTQRSADSNETIGQRLTRLRKARGMTQIELAEQLGVSQPLVSGWERGELRLHGELIIELTRLLDTTADELLGLDKSPAAADGTKNRRLLRRLRAIDSLPKRDQEALIRTIDAFLSKAS